MQKQCQALTLKDRIRERDGNKCTMCGVTAEEHKKVTGHTLDVHRTISGIEYTINGHLCVTVCRRCHAKCHTHKSKGYCHKPQENKFQSHVPISAKNINRVRQAAKVQSMHPTEYINMLIDMHTPE